MTVDYRHCYDGFLVGWSQTIASHSEPPAEMFYAVKFP